MRHWRKDKKRNKSYSTIPVDELIGHYRVTKAYKSHLKYQRYSPVGVLLLCKGIIWLIAHFFFRVTSFLSEWMSKTETYRRREKTERLSTSPASSHNITSLSSYTSGLSHAKQFSAARLHQISYLVLSSSTAHRAEYVFTAVWYWWVWSLTLNGTVFWLFWPASLNRVITLTGLDRSELQME